MKSVEINKVQLDAFTGQQKHAQFLQSSLWGNFQEQTGNKVFRQGIEREGKIIFAGQYFEKNLPLKMKYFYAPRIGIKYLEDNELIFLFESMREEVKKLGAIFLRFEPRSNLPLSTFHLPLIKTIDVQPSKTIILDLEKSEEEILGAMHQKTRYNIKLAEKKGVKIVKVGIDRFEEFWSLMSQTVDRDRFRLHDADYYKKMLSQNEGLLDLYFAEQNGKVLAANIIAKFGDMVTYVHGASSNQDRNLMAPYLLQWEIIREAKRSGFKSYDFYGIDEIKWPGVTRFKRGFGGEEIEYPGTYDLVFNQTKYKIYKTLRTIRRIL
jgi:lipid II:glycine glycyltransferase (peptidoglycan interpeptide bridge formation enzyme)